MMLKRDLALRCQGKFPYVSILYQGQFLALLFHNIASVKFSQICIWVKFVFNIFLHWTQYNQDTCPILNIFPYLSMSNTKKHRAQAVSSAFSNLTQSQIINYYLSLHLTTVFFIKLKRKFTNITFISQSLSQF